MDENTGATFAEMHRTDGNWLSFRQYATGLFGYGCREQCGPRAADSGAWGAVRALMQDGG